MQSPPNRRFVINALRGSSVALAFLLIVFLVAELGLRASGWGGPPVNRGYPDGYTSHDAYGISKASSVAASCTSYCFVCADKPSASSNG